MDLHKAVFILGAVICIGGSTMGSEPNCAFGEGREYRGTIAVTWSGKTCQRWSAQSPHKPNFTPQDYPRSGLESNYCRNPEGGLRPWCYTTDPDTRWEYCIVPKCENSPGAELTCTTGNGQAYRGTIAVTWSGRTCQRWSAQSPHSHERTPQDHPSSDLESNYCRNPDGDPRPWCYTTDHQTRWEYCIVPRCGTLPGPELTCTTGHGQEYRGTTAVTWSGKTCQRWSAQSPHSHERTPQDYPSSGLESNYCRNPDNSDGPWCYTTDPNTRWEYCRVPSCENSIGREMLCAFGDGQDYRGKTAVTRSGKICQRWSVQTPHQHTITPQNYPTNDLESNYCRNADGGEWAWCYTTDPNTRWEYCSLTRCGK